MTVLEGAEDTVIAQIIKEETDRQRERMAAEFGAQMADPDLQLSWDQLLVFGDCAARCASRAGMEVADLVRFAAENMNAHHRWGLVVFGSCLRMLARGEKGLRAGELVMELDRRKKVKASAAGKASGALRRENARVPPASTLRTEMNKLIAGGMEARNTAAKLAQKYGVTAAAIRAALKRN